MEDNKRYWIAGLLDGEGCFYTHWVGRPGKPKRAYVTVKCHMTDLDTLMRLKDWSGVGIISGPFLKEGCKPIWTWQVSTKEDAVWLMFKIFPLMSARRQAKIIEVLNGCNINTDELTSSEG